ncbi:hypothetical protein TNCV_2954672 [Trichonephila clavipes]|nr:hypothetical protein TNCV_2954672 [Trichonephila clavipes]
MQHHFIKNAHDKGHFSVKRTLEHIKNKYFIPQLQSKIEKYISNCVTCILKNKKSGKQEGFLHPLVKDDIPLNTYHIDHLGPLATSSKNYKFILAVIDSFTKFVWLYPTKTTSTSEVIKKLDIQKTTFGNPRFLITDRGTTFTSDEFHTYCSEQKITLHHITTGLPRANGQVERINRTIIPVLSKMSEDDPTKWFKHVPSLQEVLNSTFQRSINTTPFELLFGTQINNKTDLRIQQLIDEQLQLEFNENRELLRKAAKTQILKVQNENKKSYNLRRKSPYLYSVKDLVAIKKTQQGPGQNSAINLSASEDPENREMLALMAASGEDAHTNDGESYIEKYTRGVSAVESILMLDRLRQEVAVKELLAAQGKPLRKTASVPNIAHVLRMDQRLDTTFPQRMDPNSRADSACELTMQSPNDDFKQRNLSSPLTSTPFGKEKSSINSGDSPVTSYALNSPLNGLTPQSTKLVKPMSTVLEEQSLQSVPECGLDESTEFCDHSRDETCVLNLNEKLAESEDELNNFPPCRIEESSQNNTETSEIVPEKRRILETPDSIGDIQAKVGTPSMISSGYGSQALSTTPASSEDSISIHSVTEDFRDNDFSSEISAPSEDIHQQYYQQNETYIEDFNNNPSENEKLSTDNLLNPQQLDTNAETHSQGSSDGEIPQDPAAEMKFPSWLTVGESIMISPYNKTGVVAYLGPTHFAPGPWAGVELDTPTGKNDGTVNGTRYFECKPRFGIFVRPDKLVVDRRGRDMRAARNSSVSSNGTMKRSREDISVHKSHNRSDNHSTSGQWNSAKARSRSRDTTLRVSSTRGKK